MQQLFQTAILALISIVIQVFATGEGLALAMAWTPQPCGPRLTSCGQDPPASQRTGVPLPDAVRHAQEL